MRGLIVKVAPDRDEYVAWSEIVEAPHCVGTRAELEHILAAYGGDAGAERFERADRTGTSSLQGYYDWEDSGPIAEQRGVVPRDKLGEYARLYCEDRREEAYALLKPFDDDE